MRAAAAALACGVLAGLPACASTEVERAPSLMAVNLTEAQVEDAVRVALKSDREGQGWKQAGWVIESSSKGQVVAHLVAGERWMRLAIAYDAWSVSTRILAARERGQGGQEIPGWATAWQTRLEKRIGEELTWSARSPQ